MLNNLRKTADTLVMKIILAIIALAFIGWTVTGALQTTNNFDLVTFSDAKNISQEDFLREKAEQIRAIQKQFGTNLSEEQIKQLNIDNQIINKLITIRMLSYLVQYYDLDLTDETVAQLLKASPNFQNEQGVFDISLFKNFLKASYIQEQDYLSDTKERALKNTMISIFLEAFKAPSVMVKNIVDYMAETRNVEIVEIDLKKQFKDLVFPSPTINQLEEFYHKNNELFELPEKRSLSYIKISNKILQKQIQNTEEDLLDFYKNNKEEFASKKFSEVRKQIDELLQASKMEKITIQLAKNLEDYVAAGLSLIEIAKEYEEPVQHVDYISYKDLANSKLVLSQNIDEIFHLTEGELSYPIELANKEEFILVQIDYISPSKVQEFSIVREQVQKLWNEQYLRDVNLEKMKTIAIKYQPNKNKEFAEIIARKARSFSRAEIKTNQQLPVELVSIIFQTKVGLNTPVFQLKDKAYFAHIKSIKTDQRQSQDIQKQNQENIATAIKNNVIDELIAYAMQKNKIKITFPKS